MRTWRSALRLSAPARPLTTMVPPAILPLPVQTAAACGAGLIRDGSDIPSTGCPPSPADRAMGGLFQMNRRDMLKAGVAAGALGLAPRLASAQVTFAPTPEGLAFLRADRAGRADGWRHPGVDPAADFRGGRLAAPRQRHLDGQRQDRRARPRSSVRRGDASGRMGGRSAIAVDRGHGAGPDAGPLGRAGPGLGAAAERRRAQAQPRRHRFADDRRAGEGDRRGGRQGPEGRRRQGARALRLGGRQHLPQSQDLGLRRRRHH